MMRRSVIVVAVSMLAACGGLAYLHTTRDEATTDRTAAATEQEHKVAVKAPVEEPAATNAAAASTTAADSSPDADEKAPSQTTAATPESVAQWIKDTQSTDAKTRAAAIAALADAPKAQAMPALKEVLETGEPEVDRHIALRSMHALALRDGDANGQIRDVIRHAIYHSDNDGVTQTAQSLLDDIEADFAQREQPKN